MVGYSAAMLPERHNLQINFGDNAGNDFETAQLVAVSCLVKIMSLERSCEKLGRTWWSF